MRLIKNLLIFLFIACAFTACSNLLLESNTSKTYKVSGNIVSTVSFDQISTKNSRSATYSLTFSDITITAISKDDETVIRNGTVSGPVFSIDLTVGSWTINAVVKKGDDSTIVLSGSSEIEITGNEKETIEVGEIILSPVINGLFGSIELEISKEKDLTEIKSIEWEWDSDDENLPEVPVMNFEEENTLVFKIDDVPAGMHSIRLNILNREGIKCYSIPESITIIGGMKTDSWYSYSNLYDNNAQNNVYISNGKILFTKYNIEQFKYIEPVKIDESITTIEPIVLWNKDVHMKEFNEIKPYGLYIYDSKEDEFKTPKKYLSANQIFSDFTIDPVNKDIYVLECNFSQMPTRLVKYTRETGYSPTIIYNYNLETEVSKDTVSVEGDDGNKVDVKREVSTNYSIDSFVVYNERVYFCVKVEQDTWIESKEKTYLTNYVIYCLDDGNLIDTGLKILEEVTDENSKLTYKTKSIKFLIDEGKFLYLLQLKNEDSSKISSLFVYKYIIDGNSFEKNEDKTFKYEDIGECKLVGLNIPYSLSNISRITDVQMLNSNEMAVLLSFQGSFDPDNTYSEYASLGLITKLAFTENGINSTKLGFMPVESPYHPTLDNKDNYFYNPIKFVARKEDVIYIADDGGYKEASEPKNINRLAKLEGNFTSNSKISFVDVDVSFDAYTGNGSGSNNY